MLIVLTVLSFRFFRTVLQGRKRQHPFHGQASPVGVWSFLSLSSTRRAKTNPSKFYENQRKLRHNLGKIELFTICNVENAKNIDENLLKY